MKTYTMKNIYTGEEKETIRCHTLAGAQEYYDAIYPNLGNSWMLYEIK